jgi:hypothetical protein
MTPAAIIDDAAAEGVKLALTSAGAIRAVGSAGSVARWLPIIRAHKPALVAALAAVANDCELFDFAPPNDPTNDDEALHERVAIMIESNGWDKTTALREARWQADRERCWRTFQRNAKRILDAAAPKREALLVRYRQEATKRYGPVAGSNMAESMRSWVCARGLH